MGGNKATLCVPISLLSLHSYLTASSICSKEKQDSNCALAAICSRFSGTSLTSNLFLIFPHQPQECSLYFNIFVSKYITQSDSHIQEKTLNHLSVVLSVVIILQGFQPGSYDQHVMLRLDLHLSSGKACSSAKLGPGGLPS